MDCVTSLCSRALVGRLEYCHLGKKAWVDWATKQWKPLLTYIPTINLLANGWIVFIFLEAEHALVILDLIWRIGHGSLVLGCWHTHFNPLMERVTKSHLWILFPSLPFTLWNKSILEGIANTMGRFVAVDDYFHHSFDKRMAQVLVEMDVSKGLLPDIDTVCNSSVFTQRMDYLNMPFKCS